MNIVLSKNEKHPATQVDLTPTVNLEDKKVLFVYGLGRRRGDNKVSASLTTSRLEDLLHAKSYVLYSPEDDGDDTPEIQGKVSEFWASQGFQVSCVGISRNLRDNMNVVDYKNLLTEIHNSTFGSN